MSSKRLRCCGWGKPLMPRARHIEVQILGDGTGAVAHLWERECSIQRRNQKIVEIAPSPTLPPQVRDRLTAAAVKLAKEVRYNSLGTFEFLVDATRGEGEPAFAFIEANPRLQVEHTVTEEVTGIDIVKTQLLLASGKTLAELHLTQKEIPAPRGYAIQVRINMESMGADGNAKPSGGTLTAFELPSGPGVRVDTFGYAGYTTNPNFDSLLAKLIAHSPSPDFADVVTKTYRALCEFKIEGVQANVAFLQSLLKHPEFIGNRVYTRFIEDNVAELVGADGGANGHKRLFFDRPAPPPPAVARPGGRPAARTPIHSSPWSSRKSDAGTAVAETSQPEVATAVASDITGPEGTVAVAAPMQGTIVSLDVAEGDRVHAGQQLFVMEAMKMEHVIRAHVSGIVRQITVAKGDAVFEGHPLAFIEEADVGVAQAAESKEIDLDHIRNDLKEVQERHALGLDDARPEAVGRRRKTHQRTARENVYDLCDPGTFVEYGLLVIRRSGRRTIDDLVKNTPADDLWPASAASIAIWSARQTPTAS